MTSSQSVLAGALALTICVFGGCANKPPTMACKVSRTFIVEGEKTRIDTNATDPDKKDRGRLSVSWSSSAGKLTRKNGSAEFDSTGLEPGKYQVSADVSDGKSSVSCSLDIRVEKRLQPPEVACTPEEVEITVLDTTTLWADASDPDKDSLSYEWTIDEKYVYNDRSDLLFDGTKHGQGTHTVQVTVKNLDEMDASCGFTVVVGRRPNRLPAVALTIERSQLNVGDTVGASAVGSDPDDDPLRYSWALDGRPRAETSTRIRINTRDMSIGPHTILVAAHDTRNGHVEDSKQIFLSEKIVVQIEKPQLGPVEEGKLNEIAEKMRQRSELEATITGHTDDRGSEEANLSFGLRRAEAARDYLVGQHAIDVSRIAVASSGEREPLADNANPEGRKANRRVEVTLFQP
jgi:outer membrane protein OmpA-like peptidoglycan-associated protein